MPKYLQLTPYPIVRLKHGGQIRAASISTGAEAAGWTVRNVGIYPGIFFPSEEWGPLDLILESPELPALLSGDMAFADFHAARFAASDARTVAALRQAIDSFAPDVIAVEQPWGWLPLRQALAGRPMPKLIYSSQNIEWKARLPLLDQGSGLDLRNAESDAMLAATRALEDDLAAAADLIFTISDLEGEEIARETGRAVVYLPAVSEFGPAPPPSPRAKDAPRYAALMGSNYWPNVEGFFSLFPDGLGFLAPGEQIWIAGALGGAVRADPRFETFLSINESRLRALGYVAEADKAGFFADAACVIVPVTFGAGAKLKTADAIVSGRPVIATSHALEGYGPIATAALGHGIHVADEPAAFRRLIRRALREDLPGCAPAVRDQLRPAALAASWDRHARALIGQRTPSHS